MADVVEWKSRRRAERLIDNYYAAVRNAREKLEEKLENVHLGRVGPIPIFEGTPDILRGLARVDGQLARQLVGVERELVRLQLRQKEQLDYAEEIWRSADEEMSEAYREVDEAIENEELKDFFKEFDAAIHSEDTHDTARTSSTDKTQQEADKDFGF